MTRSDPQVVEVIARRTGAPDLFGSGYLVAERLVLTAAHVVEGEGSPADSWEVRPLSTPMFVPAELTWQGGEGVDLALLRVPDEVDLDLGLPIPPMRWGRLVGTQAVECQATGFPLAKARSDGEGRQIRDPLSIDGDIHPTTAAKSNLVDMSVKGSVPLPAGPGRSLWAGMSGAAVFRGPWLVGVVRSDTANFGPNRLTATLIESVEADTRFRTELPGETEAELVLELADYPDALRLPHRTPPAGFDSALLLKAAYEVVPFRGRDEELSDLRVWCETPERLSVRLVTGPGGQGKTRLAAQLCREMTAGGWLAGFLAAHATDEEIRALFNQPNPLLVVVDYAETRTDHVLALVAHATRARDLTRLLLLARNPGGWWDGLPYRARDVAAAEALHAATHHSLRPAATSPADRSDAFWSAVDTFAARFDAATDQVTEPDLSISAFDTMLFIQLAALAAVEPSDSRPPPHEPSSVGDNLLYWMLRREDERYWRPAAETESIPLDDVARKRAVAVATLTTPADEAAAIEALGAAPDFAEPGHGSRVARWLHRIYPGDRYLNPLEPDLLGEALVETVLSAQPSLVEDLIEATGLAHLDRVLTVLNRGAARYPACRTALHGALSIHATALVRQALDPSSSSLGQLLAGGFEAVGDVAIAESLVDILPPESAGLKALTIGVLQCLVDSTAGVDRAATLNDLAGTMAHSGRIEEALATIRKAIDIYDDGTAAGTESEILEGLVKSLGNEAGFLVQLDRNAEASVSIERSQSLLADLLSAAGDSTDVGLVVGIISNSASVRLALGHPEAAVALTDLALQLLDAADPDKASIADVSHILHQKAEALRALGDSEQAVRHIEAAVEFRRVQARHSPHSWEQVLASSLELYAALLADANRPGDAQEHIDEAVAIYSRLAERDRETYERRLDSARRDQEVIRMSTDGSERRVHELRRKALSLGDSGRHEEAVQALDEGLELLREGEAGSGPEGRSLAAGLLYEKAMWLLDNDDESALDAITQACGYLSELAGSDPEGFVERLTTARYFQVKVLLMLEQHDDALAAMRGGLTDLMPLVETRAHLLTMDVVALVDGYVRLSNELREAVDEGMVVRYAELAGQAGLV